MHVPPYSGRARPEEDPKGRWVEHEDVLPLINDIKYLVRLCKHHKLNYDFRDILIQYNMEDK